MRKRSIVLLVALCAVAVAGPGSIGTPANAEAAKTSWKVVGQLEEACSCSAACPCWFGSKPTKMACSGGQFIFIEKGNYGKVKLDGLGVGAMSKSPDGKGMMESFGNWDYNYYYVDEKATPEQRTALTALAKTVIAPNASPKEEIRIVPLVRTITGKEHKISLGKYGEFTGHVIEGGLGGAAKIINPPGADPLHKEYLQGQATMISYNDAGHSWTSEGSNYMFGTFEIDSEQYEKFAAGLAQKMAEMKK